LLGDWLLTRHSTTPTVNRTQAAALLWLAATLTLFRELDISVGGGVFLLSHDDSGLHSFFLFHYVSGFGLDFSAGDDFGTHLDFGNLDVAGSFYCLLLVDYFGDHLLLRPLNPLHLLPHTSLLHHPFHLFHNFPGRPASSRFLDLLVTRAPLSLTMHVAVVVFVFAALR